MNVSNSRSKYTDPMTKNKIQQVIRLPATLIYLTFKPS